MAMLLDFRNFLCECSVGIKAHLSLISRANKMRKRLSMSVFALTFLCVQPLIAQPPRTRVTEQTVFYVDPVKGEDRNPCMSAAQPCKTMQAAYDKMYSSYDFGGSNARMHLAEGDYTSGLSISGHPVGAVRVQIVGNCEN